MQKKHRAPKQVDGFTPRINGPRSVGFEPPKQRPQDFPSVGMTLPGYRTPGAPQQLQAGGARPQLGTLPAPNLTTDAPRSKRRTKRPGRWQRFKAKPLWKRILITLFTIIILIIAWLGFKFVFNAIKAFNGNPFSIFTTTKLRGEDQGHVNILLAGNSVDDKGHNGAQLTDSIMILSINTKNNTAFMLSIPRDLWVNIPGNGHAKINEAYQDGQDERFNQSGYFPGGMGLLQQTVQQNFNIQLDYYALISYNAFRDMVNAVGGIQVNIHSSDPRGLYDPDTDWTTHGPLVKLSNGTHELTGEQALDLARARGDAYGSYGFDESDFDRTNNQRMMLLALKNKINSTGVLANPLKLSNLMDAIGKNVKTDFSLSEIHRLYDLGHNIPNSQVTSVGLNDANGRNLLMNYTAPTTPPTSALAPAAGIDNFIQIQQFVHRLLTNDAIAKENASVVLLNATDTYGLAAKNAVILGNKGVNVTATADASAVQNTTTIIDVSGGKKPATKKLLQAMYGHHVTTQNPYAGQYQADFIVLLGNDRISAAQQ